MIDANEREDQPFRLDGSAAPWLRMACVLVVLSAVAAWSLLPVFDRPGWPHNHEGLTFQFRTLVYAHHLAQGDVFPVWSTDDAFGLGSPFPFYYHKLFNALSGALWLATGSVKGSIVASLWIFLLAGAVGLFRCLRVLGLHWVASTGIAAALPVQSYVLYDWLRRGAMAELSASMMLPWVVYSTLTMLRDRRIPWHLFTNLVLLVFLAHSVIGIFAALLVAAAGAVTLARARPEEIRASWRPLASGALVGALLSLPWVLTLGRLSASYSLASVVEGPFAIHAHFLRFLESHPLVWRAADWPSGVPLGPAVNAETLGMAVIALLVGAGFAWRRDGSSLRTGPYGPFLVGAWLATIALQLSWSAGFYATIPGLAYLQFPWRLIAFEQVLALLVTGWGLSRWPRRPPVASVLVFLLLASAMAGARSPRYRAENWYARSEIEAVPEPGSVRGATGIGEYLPRVELPPHLEPRSDVPPWRRYEAILPSLLAREAELLPEAAARACRVEATPRRGFETLDLRFEVACDRVSALVVKQHHSGLERVRVRGDEGWRRVRARRTPGDPRIRIDLAPGDREVHVALPRIWHALLL
jgi:hypothetical protein